MAQRTIVEMTDDVDGKPAVETLHFGVDGTEFEIDLSEKNAAKLRKAMSPFIGSARRTGGRRGRAMTVVSTGVDTAAVRAWAASHKIEVSARGRIAAAVVEQYKAAGN
jgi:hypothetical protein